MDLSAAVAVIVGVLLPFVVAVAIRPTWSPERKRTVTLAICVVVGVLVAVVTGRVEGIPAEVLAWGRQAVVTVAVVITVTQGIYRGLKDPVDKLAAATSVPAPAEPVLPDETQPRRAVED